MIKIGIILEKRGEKMMDIRVLRYFLAVAREKNITRAAELLHISQPSLSKQLIDLEIELGKKLLIRGKRKINLTKEGVLLSKRAEEIISLLEKTEKEITADSETISGEISIGGGAGSDLIIQAASYLVNKYPGIIYQLFNSDAEEVMERLDNGTLDFGILIEPVDIFKYEYISLPGKNIYGILMRKDSPLAEKNLILREDIEKIPLIIPRRAGIQRELSRWLKKDILNMNVIATFNIIYNNPSLFVKNKLGYALSINRLIDIEESNILCFRPLSPKLEIQFCIVWKRNRILSKQAEKFIEILNKYIAETI